MNLSQFADYIHGQRIKLERNVRRKVYGISLKDVLADLREEIPPEIAVLMMRGEEIDGFEQGTPLTFNVHQGWFTITLQPSALILKYKAVDREEKRAWQSEEVNSFYQSIAEKVLAKKKEREEEELPF